MFLRCFFPCKPVKESRLQRWRSRPVIFMVFMFHFWRAVDFFCKKCTCLFSSPLPVLSRIHRDGDRGGGRAVSLPHPFHLLHHKKKKNHHILSSFEKRSRQFDSFTFFFFLNTSVSLNRMYWSGSLLNRAADYCAPSTPTKKRKTKNKSSFFLAKFGSVENGNNLGRMMALFYSFMCS